MKKLALFLRYQTTYERAFYRALNSLKKLEKERLAPKLVGARPASPDFFYPKPRENATEPPRGVGFQPATPAFEPASPDFVSQTAAPTPTAPEFVSQTAEPTPAAAFRPAAQALTRSSILDTPNPLSNL
jgi:hypothetical protein